jgi:hypothetical protein
MICGNRTETAVYNLGAAAESTSPYHGRPLMSEEPLPDAFTRQASLAPQQSSRYFSCRVKKPLDLAHCTYHQRPFRRALVRSYHIQTPHPISPAAAPGWRIPHHRSPVPRALFNSRVFCLLSSYKNSSTRRRDCCKIAQDGLSLQKSGPCTQHYTSSGCRNFVCIR